MMGLDSTDRENFRLGRKLQHYTEACHNMANSPMARDIYKGELAEALIEYRHTMQINKKVVFCGDHLYLLYSKAQLLATYSVLMIEHKQLLFMRGYGHTKKKENRIFSFLRFLLKNSKPLIKSKADTKRITILCVQIERVKVQLGIEHG